MTSIQERLLQQHQLPCTSPSTALAKTESRINFCTQEIKVLERESWKVTSLQQSYSSTVCLRWQEYFLPFPPKRYPRGPLVSIYCQLGWRSCLADRSLPFGERYSYWYSSQVLIAFFFFFGAHEIDVPCKSEVCSRVGNKTLSALWFLSVPHSPARWRISLESNFYLWHWNFLE